VILIFSLAIIEDARKYEFILKFYKKWNRLS